MSGFRYSKGDIVKCVSISKPNFEALIVGNNYVIQGYSVHDDNCVYSLKDISGKLYYSIDRFIAVSAGVNSIFNPDDSMCDMNKVTVDGTVGVDIVNGVMKYQNGTGSILETRRSAFLEVPDENMDKLKPQYDDVDKPRHYNQYRTEVLDIIEDATKGLQGIEAVCIGNVLKYTMRYKFKNGVQDLEKAEYYLKKVIKLLNDSNNDVVKDVE